MIKTAAFATSMTAGAVALIWTIATGRPAGLYAAVALATVVLPSILFVIATQRSGQAEADVYKTRFMEFRAAQQAAGRR